MLSYFTHGIAEDAGSDIAIRLIDDNDYREISAKAVSAKRKLKKNRPSSCLLYTSDAADE